MHSGHMEEGWICKRDWEDQSFRDEDGEIALMLAACYVYANPRSSLCTNCQGLFKAKIRVVEVEEVERGTS